jgi:hypothetical protein
MFAFTLYFDEKDSFERGSSLSPIVPVQSNKVKMFNGSRTFIYLCIVNTSARRQLQLFISDHQKMKNDRLFYLTLKTKEEGQCND